MSSCPTYNVTVDNQTNIDFTWEFNTTLPISWSTTSNTGTIQKNTKKYVFDLNYVGSPSSTGNSFIIIFINNEVSQPRGLGWYGGLMSNNCTITSVTIPEGGIKGNVKQNGTSILVSILPDIKENYTYNDTKDNLIGVI